MKTYRITNNVGRCKYLVSFHDGQKTHQDGSPFFDLATFKNLPSLRAFIATLLAAGYTEGGREA